MTGRGSGPAPQGRRWVSEEQVLAEMERLNDYSMHLVQTYATQAVEAAEAEATHKAARARRVLKAQGTVGANGRNMAMNQAEVVAEADPEVAQAYLERLVRAAEADATREALRSTRTNQDALRTAAASHRNQVTGP